MKPMRNSGTTFAHGTLRQRKRVLTPVAVRASRWAANRARAMTIGMRVRVRVSLITTAYGPPAALKEYPAATTEDVSLMAVPAHRPNEPGVMCSR